MKTLNQVGQDLQRGVDSLTKDGSEAVHPSFTCGFLFLAFLLLAPLAVLPFLPLARELIEQTAEQGPAGQLIFALAYSAMVLGFPARALDLAIGLLYPVQEALAIVAAGRFLGLSLCYAFGQLCLQRSLSDYMAVRSSERYYLSIYRRPWTFMWLLRLLYLPAGFQSYICAACRVGYLAYLLPAFVLEMVVSAGQMHYTRGLSSLPDTLNFRLITANDVFMYSSLTAVSLAALVLLLLAWKRTASNGEELKDLKQ